MSRINVVTEGYTVDPLVIPYTAVIVDTDLKTVEPWVISEVLPTGFYEDDDILIVFDEESDKTIDGIIAVDVKFTTTTLGNFSGTMTIVSDDPDESNFEVSLLGKSIEAALGLSEIEVVRDTRHVYGVKIEQIISSSNPESFIVSQVKREIQEAVQKHPELREIVNLTLEQNGDDVTIKFGVVKNDGSVINLEEVL